MLVDLDLADLLGEFAPNPFVEDLHPGQQRLYYEPARFRCGLMGRRFGKTYTAAAALLGGQPGDVSLYFARKFIDAKAIILPVFRDINYRFDLALSFNLSDHTITEPNGAIIRLAGVKDESAAEDLRGPRYRRVVGDECFVAGTVVHPVGEVVRVMSRPAPDRLITVDGVTSTPDHPYLTPEGWKRAEDIRPGDVLCVWEPGPQEPEIPLLRAADVLAGVSLEALLHETDAHAAASRRCKSARDVGGPGISRPGTDEREPGLHSASRRQRPWAYVAGVDAVECDWFDAASRSANGEQEPSRRAADSLQIGFGRPIDKTGGRGRWRVAPKPARSSERCPERCLARWQRVDCVEVHERGREGRYGELCPDGRVYNLQTESGVYFAGGRLVHNCGTFHSELLKYTVESVIQPALVDSGGDLMLIGTPGPDPDPEDYWFQLTGDPATGLKGKWPTLHGTIYDNTKANVDPRIALADILAQNKWTTDHPTFRREYLAEWVPDVGSLVFDYLGRFERGPDSGLTVLSLDFGVVDHTSFTVLRQVERPNVWVMQSYSLPNLDIVQIADTVNGLRQRWHPNHIVADEGALGKGYALTLKRQYNIPVEPAEKRHLRARIDHGRGMLASGLIHLTPEAQELADEWKRLPWNPLKTGFHDRYKCDCTDGWLYGLQKINALDAYKPPEDTRTEEQRIKDMVRANAMRIANRATRERWSA